MPLPPGLAARLAKRGLIQKGTNAGAKNKENSSQPPPPRFVEEVIAENYDDPITTSLGDKGSVPPTIPSQQAPPPIPSYSSSSMGFNRKSVPVPAPGLTKFHRMGHYGCPNKSNIHHNCSQFCVTRWGRGKVQPSQLYNKRRLKMLKKYPLPSTWIEVYDPGAGRYYYWNTDSDTVCWLSPKHPKAKIGRSAPDRREKLVEEEKATASMPPPSTQSYSHSYERRPSNFKRDKRRNPKEELDPMDPAAYSPDCPRGTWNSGLVPETNTGVDTTASGPLFQMRPYPSPGDILRKNASAKKK